MRLAAHGTCIGLLLILGAPVAWAQDTGEPVDAVPAEPVAPATPEPEAAPPAAAEAEPMLPEREDRARFRWAIAGQGGPYVFPLLTANASSNGSVSVGEGTLLLGTIGVSGELGIQINDLVGVYIKPSIDILMTEVVGMQFTAAFMADFTILDGALSLGAGFDLSQFIAFGLDAEGLSAAAASLYGARLHVGWHPVIGDDEPPGAGRSAFTIGLDLRLLGGSVGVAEAGVAGSSSSAGTGFYFAPVISLGYTDF